MKIWTVILAGAMMLTLGTDADAQRRLGGGKSIGKQSSNVTQREATPQAPAAPTQSANNAVPGKAAAAPNAAAAAPKRPWGAMLGGLAAGLGLAWLASSLGLGEEFGQFLMFALLALVIMVVIGMVMRMRRSAQQQPQAANRSPFAFQGAAPGTAQAPEVPRSYRPENVGNDASARPWERTATSFDSSNTSGGSMIGSGLSGAQNWGVPADFDVDGFLSAAKRNFVTLQSAWDRSDISSLRAMMTDGMLAEIQSQLQAREEQSGGQPNMTEVVMIEAKLLGIEDMGNEYMASVEFSGMIREEPSAGPSPFREVWNMTKPRDGRGGWLVAGVQALQ
jgi:predicted lipid-binding transport protein (Tim44 family)